MTADFLVCFRSCMPDGAKKQRTTIILIRILRPAEMTMNPAIPPAAATAAEQLAKGGDRSSRRRERRTVAVARPSTAGSRGGNAASPLPPAVLLLLLLFALCQAELIDYDDVSIEPAPTLVHYVQFHVRGPGMIDLSHLLFASNGGNENSGSWSGRRNHTSSHSSSSSSSTNSNNKDGDDKSTDDWDGEDDFEDDKKEEEEGDGEEDGTAAEDDGEEDMHNEGDEETPTDGDKNNSKDPGGEEEGGGGGGEGDGGGDETDGEGGDGGDGGDEEGGGDNNGGGEDDSDDNSDGDDTARYFQSRRRHLHHQRFLEAASSSLSSWSQRLLASATQHTSPTSQQSPRNLGLSTVIDVVAFRLPSSCVHSIKGCDWTSLGIGAKHDDGTLRWCCTYEAQKLGLCLSGPQKRGRLIVDPALLKAKANGERRVVQVPDGGPSDAVSITDIPKIPAKDSGEYVLLMASCGDGGREVIVSGTAAVRSRHGYLPGHLYMFLYFFAVLTILYFVLVLAYGFAMHLNEDSRIPIEKWILMTIVLGLLEMTFKLGDVYVWNEDGYQQQWIALVGIVFGVMKRGWSRCLLVMVSLGWGVTRDSLGRSLKWIVVAGLTYVGVVAARDVGLVIAVDEVRVLSQKAEQGLYDVYTILTFVEAALDVLFAMWILDALAVTMEYLQSMKQSRKLSRYIRLRCLFLFAILFALVWAIFSLVTSVTSGIVGEEDAWLVDAATEINYFVVLVGVALLWRPNPSAREYAYAMELSGMRDDDEVGESELELSGTVPSAMDSFDDEDEEGHAFRDAITPPGRDGRNGGYVD